MWSCFLNKHFLSFLIIFINLCVHKRIFWQWKYLHGRNAPNECEHHNVGLTLLGCLGRESGIGDLQILPEFHFFFSLFRVENIAFSSGNSGLISSLQVVLVFFSHQFASLSGVKQKYPAWILYWLDRPILFFVVHFFSFHSPAHIFFQ